MNKELFYPVRKVPVEEINIEGLEHPSGISHAVIVTKPDGVQRVVQYCSELYHLVPNTDIVLPFEAEISKHFDVVTHATARHYSRFLIDFVIRDEAIQIAKGDEVFARIRQENSYDGSRRYCFSAGFFRLVCSNGLTLPVGHSRKFDSMHTPKLGKETVFGEVLKMASEFMKEIDEAVEPFMELQEQSVDDYMLRIEEVAEETSFPITLMEEVVDRMMLEMNTLDEGATDWLVYNAFNYQLNHNEDLKAKQGKKDTMDQEVLNYLLTY